MSNCEEYGTAFGDTFGHLKVKIMYSFEISVVSVVLLYSISRLCHICIDIKRTDKLTQMVYYLFILSMLGK